MGSALGAGRGADMLQQVLRAKFAESLQQQKLAEDIRQANMQNEIQRGGLDIQRGNLALGGRRVDEDARQFDAGAPQREAQIALTGAQTADINRRPEEAEKQRAFTSGESEKGRTFTGGQGDLNRSNALRIAGGNNSTALRIAQMNNDTREDLANAKNPVASAQSNEIEDTLALIEQISKDKALNKAVGPIDQYAGGIINADPTGVNRFKALHDQLTGKMSLAQAGKLRGQGQISDKERAMLAAAATALNRGLSEKDYLAELGKIRGQFERMRPGAPAAGPAGGGAAPAQEFDYVPGKGLVPRK